MQHVIHGGICWPGVKLRDSEMVLTMALTTTSDAPPLPPSRDQRPP